MLEKRNCVICGFHQPPPIPLHPGRNKLLNQWEFLTPKESSKKICGESTCSRALRKRRLSSPKFKEHRHSYIVQYRKRPYVILKKREQQKIYSKKPQAIALRKIRDAKPEYKAKQKIIRARYESQPHVIIKNRARQKIYDALPSTKARRKQKDLERLRLSKRPQKMFGPVMQ